MNAINLGNYGVDLDHKSCLGPNYWLLINAKKKHQNEQVLKQNILTECFNILRIFLFKYPKEQNFVGSKRTPVKPFQVRKSKVWCGLGCDGPEQPTSA